MVSEGSSSTKNELLDFFDMDVLAPSEYYVSPGHSAKGFYSMHLNAFCDIVDRHEILPNTKNVFIGDRGYCSYNNMAHVIESGQLFLFRAKDIHSKGLLGKFNYPDSESFDITVKVTLTRSNSKKINSTQGYNRFIDKATSFDFITYGSQD